jgi:hypothetical protein
MRLKYRKFYNIVLLFLYILTGGIGASCNKDSIDKLCSASEMFTEPEWIKDVQTTLENDSVICYANMRLYQWDNIYYIYLQTNVDSTSYISEILYDCSGKIIRSCFGSNCKENFDDFQNEAEELQILWTYLNESCTWKSNFNEDCEDIEADTAKIIIGKWKRTKSMNRGVRVDSEYKWIYTTIPRSSWLEFKENGEMVREYYDDNNVLVKEEGKFSIDSLLRFEDIKPSPWAFEFSYCNNSMKLSLELLAFEELIFIYEREN